MKVATPKPTRDDEAIATTGSTGRGSGKAQAISANPPTMVAVYATIPRRRNLPAFPMISAATIEPTASVVAIAPISQTPAPYTSCTNRGSDTHIAPAKPMLASAETSVDIHNHLVPNT